MRVPQLCLVQLSSWSTRNRHSEEWNLASLERSVSEIIGELRVANKRTYGQGDPLRDAWTAAKKLKVWFACGEGVRSQIVEPGAAISDPDCGNPLHPAEAQAAAGAVCRCACQNRSLNETKD